MARTTERAVTGVTACVSAATVLVVGFVAAINLAVPKLASSGLHPTPAQLLWIVDAYVVFFACLVIPAGALGDRVGRKGVLIGGLVIVGAGAAISASAGDVTVMLIGRAIAGVGAAGVLPNGLAVLVHATDAARRPRAIAVWASMTGIGGVIGNVGGGAVLTAGSWRWLFVAVVPVALGCAAWVGAIAPRSGRHHRPLDTWAAGLLTLATFALLIGIIEGPERGWASATVVGAFVLAAVLLAAWTINGLRGATPMLDPRLFGIPSLRAACLGMLIVFFGMFGLFYLNASLLQYGRGFSVLETGIGIVPLTVPVLIGARRVPALVARVGLRPVLAAAFTVTAVGLFGLATAIDEPYPVYAVWLLVVGTGVTLALPSLTIAISAALPSEQAGVAGGLQATTRELGSALGVAVIGTLLTARFVHAYTGAAHHTVAQALAQGDHATVLGAYTGAAGSALKIVALLVLTAGALVVGELAWAGRAQRREPKNPVSSAAHSASLTPPTTSGR